MDGLWLAIEVDHRVYMSESKCIAFERIEWEITRHTISAEEDGISGVKLFEDIDDQEGI